VKNINPILPDDSASADAVHLVFSGLTRFDTNGQLQPDLATDWEVSPDGRTYVFHLRHNVHWQDGVPFTAQDVLFTITAIQDPDTRSPLLTSWEGVKVAAPDPYTVIFTLPKADTPFINATTVGILPSHLLSTIEPSTMQVSAFNQHPIGTGPFELQNFDETAGQITLTANPSYYFGKPLLQGVTLKLYDTAAEALTAYSRRQVQGVSQLQPNQVATARGLGTMKIYTATQPDEVAVFFQTTTPILKDKAVRAALAEATNRQAIIQDQLDGQATALASPLLPTTLVNLGGAPHQASYSLKKAATALDADGWKLGSNGLRSKNGVLLEIHLVTQSGSIYGGIAEQLAQQWRQVGVKLDVAQIDATDLQQSYIRTRRYDALLYGIDTGPDPDVYAFWDSSQIKDPGLNLSDYDSPAADNALEAGRTLQSPGLRSVKYRNFIQTWVADTPAVMLYTPLYEYGVSASVYGVQIHKLVDPSDRFSGIGDWAVRVREVTAGPGS
ncbi:MAG TPA: peptide ABC transporter substrate-binding protein, partial [Candidatus Saccharimonadales bacterium]|nr:peptide ABC transporter substrate-binding protein [Candidatus Saccharimonadales bacterium]